jgi:hypothetical protein
MHGATIFGSGNVTSGGTAVAPDATWHVVEIGDFNGDGKSDMLWRNNSGALATWNSGALATWLMDGTSIASSSVPSSGGTAAAPDPSWQVQDKPTNFA